MEQTLPNPSSDSYTQQAYGSYTAQAAGAGAQATVKVIQLPLPVTLDLAAAKARLSQLPVEQVADVATLPAGSLVNYGINPLFCGRDKELQALASFYGQWPGRGVPTVAISGMGGVGKSQLAVEFAHRYGAYFAGGVYWVSFAVPAAIAAEVSTACAGLPDLPPGFQELEPQTQLGLILGAWRNELPRLLIFDNCEEERLLEWWRPTTGGAHVLLTSRNEHFQPHLDVEVLPLATLARRDSVTLLQKFLRMTNSQPAVDHNTSSVERLATLDSIAELLGDLPLALHVAGSYLSYYRREVPPERYLAQLRQVDPLSHRSLKQAVGGSPTQHELSVARTFAVSYERLDDSNECDRLARALLVRAAWFAPGEAIPRALVDATVDLPADEADAPLQLADAYRRLAQLGLMDTDEAGDPFLHRLLAHFVRTQQMDDMGQRAVEQVVITAAYAINQGGDPRPLQRWQVHLRHITEQALKRSDEGAATLAINLGYHLQMIGELAGAKPYLERSLAIRQQVLGEQHPDTAQNLNNLGMLLKDMGELAGAKPYLERSLAIYEQVLGEQHPDTASSLNNLGSLLQAMGELAGAKPYYERSLAIRQQVLGEQHPDTASSLNNLGSLLQAMGELAGAKPYYERSLAIRQQVLGEQHPDTASSLNNLGSLLYAMGELAGAKPYYERSLAIRQQVLGEQHPHTAGSLNNLGSLLQAMGELAGAKPYYERSLAITEQVLGEQHPDTATSLNNLGSLLQDMGDYAGAKSYLERSLAIRQQVLGEQHPDTAQSLNNLGSLLYAMGELAGAKPYLERSLAIYEQVLGEQHPHTAGSLWWIGIILSAEGDPDAARPYWERALQAFTVSLGLNHPYTQAVLNNLAALSK